jgi:hypothetical protein
LLAALKWLLIFLPKNVTAATVAKAIKDMRRPYSTRVWPSSSQKKRENMKIHLAWEWSNGKCASVGQKVGASRTGFLVGNSGQGTFLEK